MKQKNSLASYRMSLIRHQRSFLLCKDTGMQEGARMLGETGKAFVDPPAIKTQMREDSDFWSLPPLMVFCWWTLLVITKHPEDGPGIAQMDNTTAILITFWWGGAFDQEWTLPEHGRFPGADIGSNHDLLMVTFHLHLKRISKTKHTRLKFDLEKLKDPNALETFQAVTGGKLHLSPSWTMKRQTWIQWLPPSAQQWLEHPVRSLANIVRRKNPGSLQKFSICATKGEYWERKDNLKELRNTRKSTTTSRGAWKRQKKTG